MGQDKVKVSGPPEAGRSQRATADVVPLAAILGVFFILAGVYMSRPGLAWDEALYIPYAEDYRRFFSELPGTFNSTDLYNSLGRFTSHPPLGIYQMTASMQALGNSIGRLYAARASSAVSMAALVAAVYFFTLRARGRATAVWAALFLVTMPVFFSYGILATLEMPMALWWFAAAALFYAAMENRRLAWAAGLAAALAFSTKINALALPLVLWPWGLLFYRRKAVPAIVWSAVLMPVVFFAVWPFLWREPFVAVGKYFGEKFAFVVSLYASMGIDLKTAGDAAHRMIQRADVTVFYFGKTYTNAPWHYALVMTAVTTPVVTIAAAAAGVLGLARKRPDLRLAVFLLWNVAFWLVAFSCGIAKPYDGVRLFSVVFPFVAILAGTGIASVCASMPSSQGGQFGRVVVTFAVFGLALSEFLPSMPFGTSYYNELVGGLPGARAKGLTVTYWGETADSEITSYIDKNAPEGASVAAFPMERMYVENMRFLGLIRPDLKDVGTTDDWDYLIIVNRQDAVESHVAMQSFLYDAAVTKNVQGVPAAWLVEKKR